MVNLFSKIEKDSWFYEGNEKLCGPHLGKFYMSYSTSEGFQKYIEDFIKYKILKLDQPKKIYAEFGTYCGEALEHGKFPDENPNGFEGQENFDFSRRVEGNEYEKMIIIDRGEYCILGFIDIYKEGSLGDQKTGGKDKDKDYLKEDYTQTVLYAHGVELQGEEIKETYIDFIRREGSHVNPPLKIGKEQFRMQLDYNEMRLKYALNRIDVSVSKISRLKTTYEKYFN